MLNCLISNTLDKNTDLLHLSSIHSSINQRRLKQLAMYIGIVLLHSTYK